MPDTLRPLHVGLTVAWCNMFGGFVFVVVVLVGVGVGVVVVVFVSLFPASPSGVWFPGLCFLSLCVSGRLWPFSPPPALFRPSPAVC